MDGSLSTVNSSMDGSNVAVEDLLVLGIYSYSYLLHIIVSILAQVQPLRLSTASKMSTLSTARRRMTEKWTSWFTSTTLNMSSGVHSFSSNQISQILFIYFIIDLCIVSGMDAQRLPSSTSTKQLASSRRQVFHSSSEVNVSTCKIELRIWFWLWAPLKPSISFFRLNRPQDAMEDAETAKDVNWLKE